jgi:hypothetical protein
MKRYWINAPSTLQSIHLMHGQNVLCDVSDRFGECVTVYFTSGPTISAMIPSLYLSKGWK